MLSKSQISVAKIAGLRERFVDAYMALGENALRAYLAIKPHVKSSTAGVEGHRLLKNPKVQSLIDARREALRARYALTTERVLEEQAKLAYFDPRKLVDQNGVAIPLHELDEDTAAALSGVQLEMVETTGEGDNKVERRKTIVYRPYSKPAVLNMLNKILGIYDRPLATTDPAVTPIDSLDLARRMAFILARGAKAATKAADAGKGAQLPDSSTTVV